MKKYLDKDQLKLYTLIWSRFVASQMTPAILDTMKVTLQQNGVTFIANGSKVKFKGFMQVYVEGRDDGKEDKENILPELVEGDVVKSVDIEPKQHFTQPPARFSEATLIRTLEENGVGRPSTYAPTLETIQRRYYVKLTNKRFEPTELGEIVNSLVSEFFPQIVDTHFTATMETDLDKVGEGQEKWVEVVDRFYKPFEKELTNAEEKIEKSKLKMNQQVLTANYVDIQWWLNWVATGNFMHVVISQIVGIQKRLSKKLAWRVLCVTKGKLSNANQRKIGFSMAVVGTQSVTSLLGTNQ